MDLLTSITVFLDVRRASKPASPSIKGDSPASKLKHFSKGNRNIAAIKPEPAIITAVELKLTNLYKEVLVMTNDFPDPYNSKIYGKEPRYRRDLVTAAIFSIPSPLVISRFHSITQLYKRL